MKVVALFLSMGLLAVLAFGATGTEKEQKVTITMTDFKFTPSRITIRAGVPAEIILRNKGKVEHEFMVYAVPKVKVSDWDEYIMGATYFADMGEIEGEFEGRGAVAGTRIFEVEVKAGRSAELKFTPAKTGTFEIGCHVQGHYEAGMKGVLVVK